VANPHKVGLVIGALTGGWHFVWSLLVGIGWRNRSSISFFGRT
jgi:hypothetical protein